MKCRKVIFIVHLRSSYNYTKKKKLFDIVWKAKKVFKETSSNCENPVFLMKKQKKTYQ